LSEDAHFPDEWVTDLLAPMAVLVRSYPQTGRNARMIDAASVSGHVD
jgi:hypothetical protein